jgi:hypothetical protein
VDDEVRRELENVNRYLAEKENAPLATRNAVWKLNELVGDLNDNTMLVQGLTEEVKAAVKSLDSTVAAFHKSSDRSARRMEWLTVAIVLLTACVAALAVVTALKT